MQMVKGENLLSVIMNYNITQKHQEYYTIVLMVLEQQNIINLILVKRILSNLHSFTKVPKSGTLSHYQLHTYFFI